MTRAILLDLDGTVYKGSILIPGVLEAIDNIIRQKIQIYYCTNNSSKTPEMICSKLNGMGIECGVDQVLTSGMMAVQYAKQNGFNQLYISGTDSLKKMFLDSGFSSINSLNPDALIIGMDPDYDYQKMTESIRAAMNARFIIACNTDKIFPKEDGIYPGCGAMVSSIIFSSERKIDCIVGKPNIIFIDYVAKQMNIDPKDIVVVGDTIASDVAMAKSAGSHFVFVGKSADLNSIKSLADTIEWDWSIIFSDLVG